MIAGDQGGGAAAAGPSSAPAEVFGSTVVLPEKVWGISPGKLLHGFLLLTPIAI